MTRELKELATIWLRSELEGDDTRAQQALSLLVRALPSPVPSPGLAERVLVALGRKSAVERFLAHAWGRALLASSLALTGLALASMPASLWALLRTVDLARIVDVAVELTTACTALLDFGLSVWRVFGDVGRALGLALSVPELALPLLASALLALLALRVLLHTAALHWSPVHVDTARS